jgi:hypothetical protein
MATHRRVVDVDEPAATLPCAVHLRRADGLDVEVSGDGRFVSATLERVLVALGIVGPPS